MKKIISILVVLAMVLAFAGCGNGNKTESDLEYIKQKGNLIVGVTVFEPMDYQDANGEWLGFDADVAKLFAESLGVKAEFIIIDWDNKIMEINNKSIDCVWNGMTLTDEVTKSMECGKPYCDNAQVVVVKAENADKYQTKESLADLVFAVEAGSAGEDAVTELGVQYTAVQTQADAVMEVAAGTSDACAIDLIMAGAMIGEGTSYSNLTYTVALTTEEYGVGFRKGSELAEEFNKFYKENQNGSILETAKIYGVQESLITYD